MTMMGGTRERSVRESAGDRDRAHTGAVRSLGLRQTAAERLDPSRRPEEHLMASQAELLANANKVESWLKHRESGGWFSVSPRWGSLWRKESGCEPGFGRRSTKPVTFRREHGS